MPFAETSTGARIHYEHLNMKANAIPVVVLHGLLGTGRKDLGHVLDWLVDEGYEVIAPSLRGYGESTPKPRDFPYKFYERDAKDVLAFLDAIDVKRCHILGYSDGGDVTFICAGTDPERFATVATIGAVGYLGPDIRAVIMGYRPGSKWITQEEIEMHEITDPDRFAAQWVRSMVQSVDSGGGNSINLTKNMTMPVLVMLGDRDKLNPREYADKFLEDVADGAVVMFDAGHPVHDHQTEKFRAVWLSLLKSVDES